MYGKEDIVEYEIYWNIVLKKWNYFLNFGEMCLLKFDVFLNKMMDKLELYMLKFERRES